MQTQTEKNNSIYAAVIDVQEKINLHYCTCDNIKQYNIAVVF